MHSRLNQNPFTASFNKFVQHDADVIQYESTNIETKELSCVPCAKLEADMRLGGMFESWILDLTRDLVWIIMLVDLQNDVYS